MSQDLSYLALAPLCFLGFWKFLASMKLMAHLPCLCCCSLSLSLLFAYGWHATRTEYPLLRISLFKVRTFLVSVIGGFITRFGVGGMPFLLPLLYQLGLGYPAWKSGLLMMPTALAAMGMKLISVKILQRFGYWQVLLANTFLIGTVISLYSFVAPVTPVIVIIIVMTSFMLGFFNSLQFSSMNTIAYADIEAGSASTASTLASSLQQMSMSFGPAFGSLLTGWYMHNLPQSDHQAVISALHHAFLFLGALTIFSSLCFLTLKSDDGESVSRGTMKGERVALVKTETERMA